jgi:hypothetical protein
VNSYQLAATYYRATVLLGIATGEEVIRWADGIIERDPAPPAAIYDVSLTPAADLNALRDALKPLALEPEPLAVVRALLDRIWHDVLAGRRDVDAAVALIYRASNRLAIPDPLRWEMVALEEDYALVTDGIAGDLPTIEAQVRAWLAQFDGAADALFASAG